MKHGRTIEAIWRANPSVAPTRVAPKRVAPKRTFGDFLNYLWSFVWMR